MKRTVLVLVVLFAAGRLTAQMAAGVIITVPLLIAVLIFQRRIVAGLTAGGVK